MAEKLRSEGPLTRSRTRRIEGLNEGSADGDTSVSGSKLRPPDKGSDQTPEETRGSSPQSLLATDDKVTSKADENHQQEPAETQAEPSSAEENSQKPAKIPTAPGGEGDTNSLAELNQVDGMDVRGSSWIASCKRFTFVVLPILAFVITLTYSKKSISPYTHFHTELSVMEKAFSKQTPRFWKLLSNPTGVHLNNTAPLRPLVIMLTGGPESSTVMECIAKKLAFAIDRKFNTKFEIHGRKLKDTNGDEAKKFLDDNLRNHFGKGNRVAIIHNLELLPAPSPLIFYSFCDDQNAEFKTSTIIFTVQLPEAVPEHLTNIQKETFVTDLLKNTVWSGNPDVYGEDRIAALLSRITTSVAIVQEENNANELCTETCAAKRLYPN